MDVCSVCGRLVLGSDGSWSAETLMFVSVVSFCFSLSTSMGGGSWYMVVMIDASVEGSSVVVFVGSGFVVNRIVIRIKISR